MIRKTGMIIGVVITLVLGYWYSFLALDEIPMEQAEIVQKYQYDSGRVVEMVLTEVEPRLFTFTYKSFDGSVVNGQISYPNTKSKSYPVLIGISAMGRSYVRWWVKSFKGRPTVTQVNKIATLADRNGYVVISIDARYHGKRKDPNRTLGSIMNNLRFFGDKTPYETMVRDTVLDHRVLLDWVEQQKDLDKTNIKVVGYSMGGQIVLILASLENRISEVISIVPPFINDTTALVAPKNFVSLLENIPVLLITADDDENSSPEENEYLYSLIPSNNKKRIDFPSNHILPEGYVSGLSSRFSN